MRLRLAMRLHADRRPLGVHRAAAGAWTAFVSEFTFASSRRLQHITHFPISSLTLEQHLTRQLNSTIHTNHRQDVPQQLRQRLGDLVRATNWTVIVKARLTMETAPHKAESSKSNMHKKPSSRARWWWASSAKPTPSSPH